MAKAKAGPISNGRLKSFLERIEKLREEKKAIGSDERDVFAEAKGVGYDAPTMRWLLKEREVDAADRAERDILRETYAHALSMAVDLVRVEGLSLRQAEEKTGASKSSIQRALAVPEVSREMVDGDLGGWTTLPAAGVPAAPVIRDGEGSTNARQEVEAGGSAGLPNVEPDTEAGAPSSLEGVMPVPAERSTPAQRPDSSTPTGGNHDASDAAGPAAGHHGGATACDGRTGQHGAGDLSEPIAGDLRVAERPLDEDRNADVVRDRAAPGTAANASQEPQGEAGGAQQEVDDFAAKVRRIAAQCKPVQEVGAGDTRPEGTANSDNLTIPAHLDRRHERVPA
jgi:uncharacterized protein (UPF0335 family)